MRFLIHKRRNTPTVIIVALVDVLIVLLIFLMVTTTFKKQSSLKLTLPESSQSQKTGSNENPPLVVSIDTNGMYYLDKLPKTFEQVKSELISRAEKNPQLILAINADENAPWGKVVKIRDAAAEAKIKTLVAYTREAKP
ncbi:MAG TPA: biopolymer transporter ExbD [Candidatus Acidoferrum sp.]|nr:biopolymer transporter ExbD [Candidatus Acidoferrum sp.]